MAQAFVTHNAELLELLAPQLEIELSQIAADSLKTQVKIIVHTKNLVGFVNVELA
jgi:hypothetical protein